MLASSGVTLEFLKELVATSIESDDVAPLVKVVFDVPPAGDQPPAPPQGGGEPAAASQGDAEAGQDSVADAVLALLQEVAEEKEAEIQQICRANAPEIAGTMQELSAMQRDTTALRQKLLASNAALQQAGAGFAGRLERVQEAAALQAKVAAARRAVKAAVRVLQLCAKASKYIEGRQLYKAFKTLETIQLEHGDVLRGSAAAPPLLPSAAVNSGTNGSIGATPMKLPSGGPAASREAGGAAELAEQLGPLAAFLRDHVARLVAQLEQRAVADFNDWLAAVRAAAGTVGMRAVRWAAAERQQEEALARQRKLLLPALDGLADLRAAGALAARTLLGPEVWEAPPATPLPLPAAAVGTPAAAAPIGPAGGAGPPASSGSTSGGTNGGDTRSAAFRAARQAAGSSPTRTPRSGGGLAAAVAGVQATAPATSPPGTAASSSASAAAAAGAATRAAANAVQTPPPAQQQGEKAPDASHVTGDLLEGVDMAPLHRCLHIHSCLGRLPQLADAYARNRRQQLEADLALPHGDFLGRYQPYLAQLAGFFLIEDGVAAAAAAGAGEHPLDIAAQVDASWDAAVAALKAVLEPAFQGATAASAMLAVKDFILLVCLALDHCGYQTVAVREVLMHSRTKYHELLGVAAAASVKAAVAADSLAQVEVGSEARAHELFGLLALPPTFQTEDAPNKRPPFKAPFSGMVPALVRAARAFVIDSVAYLKGLLTAGEVVPAARQWRDRLLARVVAPSLQRRLDAAAGDTALPLGVALQLVANVAALLCTLQPLDDFLLAQARGETAETAAAAAAAAAASRSPSPGRRSGSRSTSPAKRAAAEEARGRHAAAGEEGRMGGARVASPAPGSPGQSSSHASSPSPVGARLAAASQPQQAQQAQAGSQQSGHTALSFTAAGGRVALPAPSGGAPSASSAPAGSAAAAMQGLLASAEALAVQSAAAGAAAALAAGEQLDWAPAQQQRSTAYSPYIDELIMHLKECTSLLKRAAPADSVERMLRGMLRYVADAIMLQLLSDAIPAFNIFGLQRLLNDLGGISRAAGSLGVAGLADELAEPLLFCELMVFGTLEDVLAAEARAPGGRFAALDLQRLVLLLGKYREVERASGFAAMHKSKQAERFISRKTVDRVLKELREASRPTSRASSGGSFTLVGGGGGGGGGSSSHGGSFTTAAKSG